MEQKMTRSANGCEKNECPYECDSGDNTIRSCEKAIHTIVERDADRHVVLLSDANLKETWYWQRRLDALPTRINAYEYLFCLLVVLAIRR